MAAILSAVGDKITEGAITKVKDMICKYMSDQYEYQGCSKAKLQELDECLTPIQAAIIAAQKKEVDNPALAEWLDKLKDAVYDAEDLLDTIDYRMLEADQAEADQAEADQAEAEDGTESCISCISGISIFLNNIIQPQKILRSAYGMTKRLLFLDEEINELIDLVYRFKRLSNTMHIYLQVVQLEHSNLATADRRTNEIAPWRLTTSTSPESKIVGRENEISRLVGEVMSLQNNPDSSSYDKNYSTISVVGVGGIGKTTIVQSVYNNEDVDKHFDTKAWVCVSQRFEIRKIYVELIESISNEQPNNLNNLQNLDNLQKILQNYLKGKKFLIVLDDLWDDMQRSSWETLSSPFRVGKEGSKVVITTRDFNVAKLVGSMKTVELYGMEEEEYWGFFKHYAFGSGESEIRGRPKLEKIGKEIIKRLGRSPLAGKVIGSLLRSNLEEDYWLQVLENKLWDIERRDDGVFAALRLSYNNLPFHLRQCFGYCSLFPQDYQFEKDQLIYMWMGLGYVQSKDGRRRPEDIGEGYFNELEARCFIQKDGNSFNKYVIHDLLHDLATGIFEAEICQVNANTKNIPKTVRHLFVHSDNILDHIKEFKGLRSLFVAENIVLSEEKLKELKVLRVLIFRRNRNISSTTLIKFINSMIHLRYLYLDNFIYGNEEDGDEEDGEEQEKDAAISLDKLLHLETLIFPGVSVEVKDKKIKLTSVRKLDPRHSAYSVKNISRLTSLQKISWPFTIRRQDGYRISELKNLNQIRDHLIIYSLQNVEDGAEAKQAELVKKNHLKRLELFWDPSKKDGGGQRLKDEEVLEGLQPPPSILNLNIKSYNGSRYPSWLLNYQLMSNLESIRLYNCDFSDVFPPLGQLPFLKIIVLHDLRSLIRIGVEFYGVGDIAFPSLEELTLSRLENLVEWTAPTAGKQAFPMLESLTLQTPNLRGCLTAFSRAGRLRYLEKVYLSTVVENIPRESLSRLEGVILIGKKQERLVPVEQVKECFQQMSSIKALTIIELEEELPNSLFTALKCFSSLEALIFSKCNMNKWLPMELPACLKFLYITNCHLIESLPELPACLEVLSINHCPLIESLPDLPTTLQELEVIECRKLRDRYDRAIEGSEWHKISNIPEIKFRKRKTGRITKLLTLFSWLKLSTLSLQI